jgi:hypothetical protein
MEEVAYKIKNTLDRVAGVLTTTFLHQATALTICFLAVAVEKVFRSKN